MGCSSSQKSVNVPVIAVGGINDPMLAEKQSLRMRQLILLLLEGVVIADPEFPQQG